MIGFLSAINEYVSENGIPFKDISISSAYFPSAFNKAIVVELKKNNSKYNNDEFIKNYTLRYDSEGKLYLQAIAYDNHTTLLIADNNTYFSKEFKGKVINEGKIINSADLIDFKTVNELIENNSISKRFIKDIINIESMESIINKSAISINEYIGYLNNVYQEQLQQEENDKKIIFYCEEPEASRKEIGKNEKNGQHKERVNTVIPFEERNEVLKNNDYLMVGLAKNKNNNKITSVNYLYSIGDNNYVIIMEPYTGDKHTKISYFHFEETITKEIFAYFAKKYLEMSREEIKEIYNITRHSHTSLASFTNLVSLVLGEQKQINPTATKKILAAKKYIKEQ